MRKLKIKNCPGSLEPGFESYNNKTLKQVFDGKKVSHQLQYIVSNLTGSSNQLLNENRVHISISGMQAKYSLKQIKNKLLIADISGTHILKPIPSDLENVAFVPANEHLTMQIASQVFKLNVAKNALIFFADHEPAYITKRFDVQPNGDRSLKEDFASILQKTSENGNKNYKYDSSYYEMALAIDKYLPTAIVSKEALFKLVVFNYLMSNGDAHLKNFSVIDYQQDGFYQLAPAYDLLCTRLHIFDQDFALNDALYDGDHNHPSFTHYGFHAYDDFYDFGIKLNLQPKRIEQFLALFISKSTEIKAIVKRSFLNKEMQELYLKYYDDKLKRLTTSLSGKI